MDISWEEQHDRYHDLVELNKVRNNEHYPHWKRERANKAIQKITAQLNDKTIVSLRERLVKAVRAEDQREQWKITQILQELQGKERIE